MKKYILGMLITPILIGLTQAGTITCGDGDCTPEFIDMTTNGGTCESIFSFTTTDEYGQTNGTCYGEDNTITIQYSNRGEESLTCDDEFLEGTYTCEFSDGGGGVIINYTEAGGNEGGGNEGGGNEGGGNEGGNTGGGIVAGGTEAFNGIITKLGSILGEFGPYILYIAIACLGISLLFKALKSLLGFTNNKAKNSIGGRTGMKERRRRRRQQRRKKRTEQEARKYYTNDNYDRNEAGNGKLYRRSRKNSNYLKQYRYKR